MKKNQTIQCNVNSCEYNDTKKCLCNLETINVSCNCNKDDCTCKKETICDSFKTKEGN